MTNQINIQKAANGYIVSVPFQPYVVSPDESMRQQARILKEEFQGDPELMKLKESETTTNELPEFNIQPMPTVFVFHKLEELIGFLKTYL